MFKGQQCLHRSDTAVAMTEVQAAFLCRLITQLLSCHTNHTKDRRSARGKEDDAVETKCSPSRIRLFKNKSKTCLTNSKSLSSSASELGTLAEVRWSVEGAASEVIGGGCVLGEASAEVSSDLSMTEAYSEDEDEEEEASPGLSTAAAWGSGDPG